MDSVASRPAGVANVRYHNVDAKLSQRLCHSTLINPFLQEIPRNVTIFPSRRLDDPTLTKRSKENVTEESQADDVASPMPLDKTRAKYLYPQQHVVNSFKIVLV